MKKKGIGIIAIVLVLGIAAGVYFLVIAPGAANAPEPSSGYTPGEYIVTNIKDSNSLVKAAIVLQVNKALDDQEFSDFMKANNHIIRDIIVMTLRSKTYDELMSPDIKAVLSDEIVSSVNEALGIDNVKAIYFNDYVIQ